MVQQDLILTRGYKPTPLTDPTDPPQFGQTTELVKDAVTEILRAKFKFPQLSPERKAESPTVRKYAFGYAPNTDPYPTYQQLAQEFPDFAVKYPEVGVTAESVSTAPVGWRRQLETTWPAPVLLTTVGPWAFADAVAQVSTVQIDAVTVGAGYTLYLDAQPSTTYVAESGDTPGDVIRALRMGLQDTGSVTLEYDQWGLLTLTGPLGQAFEVGIDAPVDDATVTTLVEAGDAGAYSWLDVEIGEAIGGTADGVTYTTYRVPFDPVVDPTAVTAAELAACFRQSTNRKLLGFAATSEPGALVLIATPGVRTVEVLSSSSQGTAETLGLARSGTGTSGDTCSAPGTPILTIVISGAAFSELDVGDNLQLGAVEVRVLSFVSADSVTVEAPNMLAEQIPEDLDGVLWFIGLRADRRDNMPVSRYVQGPSQVQVQVQVWTESPTTRTELCDSIDAWMSFFMEERFFTYADRSVNMDPIEAASIPESWTIHLEGSVERGPEPSQPLSGDEKKMPHLGTVTFTVICFQYLNRYVSDPNDTTLPWTITSIQSRDIIDPSQPAQ